LEEITFDYKMSASKQGAQPFKVTNSSKITFSKSTFDLAGGYAYGTGLHVTNSSQVTLESSEITSFHRGTEFRNITGSWSAATPQRALRRPDHLRLTHRRPHRGQLHPPHAWQPRQRLPQGPDPGLDRRPGPRSTR